MPSHNWNERYQSGDAPWDTGRPNLRLMEFVQSHPLAKGRALDVGCGTGTNALWLAEQGFSVVGVDVSSVAIEMARAKAESAVLESSFIVSDFLSDAISGAPFNFVFDMGCFHLFDEPEDRKCFVERVASLLDDSGLWLSLIGSTEGAARDGGPPRRSASEVIGAIEPVLEILEFHAIEFDVNMPFSVAGWLCVSRRRRYPVGAVTQ